jgi:hypothetical protein
LHVLFCFKASSRLALLFIAATADWDTMFGGWILRGCLFIWADAYSGLRISGFSYYFDCMGEEYDNLNT